MLSIGSISLYQNAGTEREENLHYWVSLFKFPWGGVQYTE